MKVRFGFKMVPSFFLFKAKSEDACERVQSSMKGPDDVGFAGQCPSPSYKEGDKCCCGEGCCWDKCTWENPPNDCLNGLYKGQWLFDIVKEHFFAVNYWENSGKSKITLSLHTVNIFSYLISHRL